MTTKTKRDMALLPPADAAAADVAADALPTEFVVVVDTREQAPYSFSGIKADANRKNAAIEVRTIRKGLSSGDYSLEGYETSMAIERKSLIDLFGTLGQGRLRFERELKRLSNYDFASVVVEADWETILFSPPLRSQLRPKTIHRSVIAWQQRYPRIHWWFLEGRALAEKTTFRILERFWRDRNIK